MSAAAVVTLTKCPDGALAVLVSLDGDLYGGVIPSDYDERERRSLERDAFAFVEQHGRRIVKCRSGATPTA